MKALLLAAVAALAALAACTENRLRQRRADRPARDEQTGRRHAPQVPAVDTAEWTGTPRTLISPSARATWSCRNPSADDPLLVPMLLPAASCRLQSDRPTPPRVTKDGYFATYHLPRYDVIVNGSQKAYAVGGATPRRRQGSDEVRDGGSRRALAFSRYGADYVIDIRMPRGRRPRRLHHRSGSQGICGEPVCGPVALRRAQAESGDKGRDGRVGSGGMKRSTVRMGAGALAGVADARRLRQWQRAAVAVGGHRRQGAGSPCRPERAAASAAAHARQHRRLKPAAAGHGLRPQSQRQHRRA